MKVLITGASGLLGATAARKFVSLGWVVCAVSNTNFANISGCKNVSIDLLDKDKTSDLFELFHPDVVVHCAALTNVDFCEKNKNEAYSYNIMMTKFLAEKAKEYGSKFVFISTDSVFDGKESFYKEEDTTHPVNTYASTKVIAEHIIRQTLDDHVIVRGSFFGVNITNRECLSEWILNNVRAGNYIKVFSDVFFSPLTVERFSFHLENIISSGVRGVFHAGSVDRVSKEQFARMLCREFGLSEKFLIPISVNSFNFEAHRPKDCSLDSSKLVREVYNSLDMRTTVQEEIECLRSVIEENPNYSQVKHMYSGKEKIYVVIPALNEEKTIGAVIDSISPYVEKVVIIDDGSRDDTSNVARSHGATVYKNPRNIGYEASLSKGFKIASDSGATIIASMDADGQHTPESLKSVLAPLVDNSCDVCVGVRNTKQRISERLFALYSNLFYNIKDPLCGLKAYRTYVYKTVGFFDKIGSIGTQLLFETIKKNFIFKQVNITIRKRKDIPRFGRFIVGNYKILRAFCRIIKKYKI